MQPSSISDPPTLLDLLLLSLIFNQFQTHSKSRTVLFTFKFLLSETFTRKPLCPFSVVAYSKPTPLFSHRFSLKTCRLTFPFQQYPPQSQDWHFGSCPTWFDMSFMSLPNYCSSTFPSYHNNLILSQ